MLKCTPAFHTFNQYILLLKCGSDDEQILGKMVFRARVNAPNANIFNLSPSNAIIMGF